MEIKWGEGRPDELLFLVPAQVQRAAEPSDPHGEETIIPGHPSLSQVQKQYSESVLTDAHGALAFPRHPAERPIFC